MYQYNVPYRGTPEDRVYRRELRPRRTRSEDPRSSRQFIDDTLSEIRRKQSMQTGADMRMSYEEIDQLLNNIRRSRSQSQTNEETPNEQPCRPDVTKTYNKSHHPPPPQISPPPLPRESTPFGEVLSSNWSPNTRRSRTPRRLKTTSLYCQGSAQTSKEPLNMPETIFWKIGHTIKPDEKSSSPKRSNKSKQTCDLISNADQKPSDKLQGAHELMSRCDVSPGNVVHPGSRIEAPAYPYNHPTRRMSGTHLEHNDVPSDKNFNEHEKENPEGGSASPNTNHYQTNKQFCMTDIRLRGVNNNTLGKKCMTGNGCEEKSQSSRHMTDLNDPKLETRPDIAESNFESHHINKPSNIFAPKPKMGNKTCQKKCGVLWNDNPVYQPTNIRSSSKFKDKKDQTKTCYEDPSQKKLFNVSDIHEMDTITSFKKEVDDKEQQKNNVRTEELPDLENYVKSRTETNANMTTEKFQKECADIEQDAFQLVNDLKLRLADMTHELEKVKAAADQLNDGIHEMSSEDESSFAEHDEVQAFYTVEEPEEIPNEDCRNTSANSLIIEDMSREETAVSPVFDRSDCVLPKPIVIQRIHPPFTAYSDNNPSICSDGYGPSATTASVDDEHFQSSNFRLAEEKKEEGNQLYKLKQYRDALSKYSEAIDLCPQCVSFYGNRSACYLMLGQPRQALEDARTSTNLDPDFTKGWTRVARCCVMLGDTVSAKQALTKLGNLGEDNTTEQRNIEMVEKMVSDSQQSYQAKDYRKSLWCLDKALEVATHSLTIKTSRAECLAFLGRYTEASEAANSVLQFDNLNADAIYVRGLCLYYEDNVDRAFSHFTQVLRFAPDHVKAKEIYKKAKSLKTKKEEGNTAFKAGNLEEAYRLYSDALQIDPCNRTTNAKLYFNRATVASKLKKTAESIADCDRALDLDPNYTKALLRRAKTYMETEQYEEAVRDYEKVMKADRGNMEYRQLLQEAKLELKKSKRKDYYKILGVDKNANEEEIKKAYRKRAMVHHPDRHSGATEAEQKDHEHKFKEVGEAYAILSDEKKRRMYDSGQDLDGGEGHGFHDVDPNSIFQAFFGGGGMGGHPGMGGHHGGHNFHFGGGHGGGAQSFSFQFG